MDASRWTDLLRRAVRELWRELRGLGGNERLAAVGVATMALSLLLPWYGVPFQSDLGLTGVGAFSFAEAALLLIGAATLALALRVGGGYVPPRPLSEGGLLIAAGTWAALIVGYRMLDRPEFTLFGLDEPYTLRYGIFVAVGGAALIVLAGLRARRR